jgi:tellurite resistance protein TerC
MAFFAVVFICLWLDLHAHRSDKPISTKNAALWSIFWIALSFAFAGYVAASHGSEDAMLYITGYLVEKSLSVDNLFVIMAIFSSFAVPENYQHRVLYYGIVGALIMRLLFIGLGAGLVMQFGKVALGIFALFILWSAWKMWQAAQKPEREITDYSRHWSVNLSKRLFPTHHMLDGHKFFSRQEGIYKATPLFLCLVTVEFGDIMFAVDSVPAVISVVGANTFLAYTSNVFAILGLRSLYFLLAAGKRFLVHLEKAVIVVLVFISVKMMLDVSGLAHIGPNISLLVVLALLAAGVVLSCLYPARGNG